MHQPALARPRRTSLRAVLLLLAALLFAASAAVPSARAQQTEATAEAAFAEAYGLYADRLYEQAVVAFDAFRRAHPEHVAAAEALYYQAESALALGREDEAERLLTLFGRRYPVHPLAFQARLALGQYYAERGAYEQTIEALDAVLADDPPADVAAKALYWMGEAALALGRTEEALAYFRRAADDYRDTPTAPVALYTIAYTQLEMGRAEDAARTFETLGARYPESNYARNLGLALAEVYYDLSDYERVVEEIERRLPTLEGEAAERAEFLRAEAYNQLRRSEDAIYHYRQFLEAHPDSPYYRRARYGLAWNYHFEDAFEWAADEFATVRESGDDDLAREALYYEAVNRKLAHQDDRAADLFRRYAEQYPGAELADHALYELGVALYEQRLWEESAAVLDDLVRAYPSSERLGEALYLRGNAAVAQGAFDEAFDDFSRAADLDAAPASLREEIVFQRAWLLYGNGRYAEAAPAFLALAEGDAAGTKASDALFWAAESFYQSGALDRAERLFRQYLEREPGGKHRDAAHYALGWVHFKQGRYADAARAFERFLDDYRVRNEAVPYRTDALLRLADSYYALKRYPEAVRAYGRVAAEGEDYALYQIGQAYANAGDAFEAITTFRRLLETYNESEYREEARYKLGYLYFLNADYDRAIEAYEALLAEAPRDPLAARALYGIGDALYNAGRLDEAVSAYERVLSRYPDSPLAGEAASSILYALTAAGEDARAEALIDSFATANPSSPVVAQLRFRQGEVRYQSGQREAAREAFEGFVGSSSDPALVPDALYYLSQIYLDAGETAQAESTLRRLLDGYPSAARRPDALAALGALFLDADRAQEALVVYEALERAASGDARRAAEARYGQSRALIVLGELDRAEGLLRDVVDAAPDAPTTVPALLGLARVYEAQGRTSEAVRTYRRVVDTSREETGAEALLRLGTLLLARGDARAAVDELGRMPVLYAPFPEYLAQGYLAQARAFEALGQTGEAARLYDRVMQDYAGTPWARRAADAKGAL